MKKILRDSSLSVRQTLLSTGVKTVASLLTCDAARITHSQSDKHELECVQEAVVKKFACFPTDGHTLLEDIMASFYILSTGCDHWDELLDGGLYSGEITEVVGSAGSGKTQVCLSIASFLAMNLEKNVIYIDTQGSFSSHRIKEILKTRDPLLTDQDINAILSRIRCYQTFDLFGLMEYLSDTKNNMYNEDDSFYGNVQLLVVDSVASVITPVLGGQQINGHSMMVHLSRNLKSLAVHNGLAVLVTNNVVSDSKAPHGGVKPALGPTWSHFPNTRIFIQKGMCASKNEQTLERFATVTKSSRQPVQISTSFCIQRAGIQDALLREDSSE